MPDHLRSSKGHHPTLKSIVGSPAYDRAASNVSKSYIFLFLLFCGIIAYLDQPNLGWLWIPLVVIGIFVASIFFAMPATFLKMILATKGWVEPFSTGGRYILLLVDIVAYSAMWTVSRATIGIIASMLQVTQPSASTEQSLLESNYLNNLREWIEFDGSPETIQERVIEPCSKLVMITADEELAAAFLRREEMEEYDFRSSFCMKATVHQLYPQPEFDNTQMISGICAQNPQFFKIICEYFEIK